MKQDRTYLLWGITAFCVICGVLVFYDTVFQHSVLFDYLGKLASILSPVCYGFGMAYVLSPVVNALEGLLRPAVRRLRRETLRALSILLTWVLVFIAFYLILRVLLPQLYSSVLTLVGNAETYYNTILNWVQKFLEDNPSAKTWMSSMVEVYYHDMMEWLRNTLLPQVQGALASLTTTLTTGVFVILNFFKNLLVGIIISIYLLATKESFAASGCKLIYSLFSQRRAAQVIAGAKTVNRIFSGFFRGKLLDSLIIGILCFLCSSILKFPYTPLVSVVVGVTNIIPFFGPFLGAIPCAFIILLDSPLKCLYFIIFIVVLQQFDGNILGPKILGDSTGLSSFWVIVAILVGGGLWGILGMFIGVPLFACLYTGVRRFCVWRLEEKGLPVHAYNYRTHTPVTDEELEQLTLKEFQDTPPKRGKGKP